RNRWGAAFAGSFEGTRFTQRLSASRGHRHPSSRGRLGRLARSSLAQARAPLAALATSIAQREVLREVQADCAWMPLGPIGPSHRTERRGNVAGSGTARTSTQAEGQKSGLALWTAFQSAEWGSGFRPASVSCCRMPLSDIFRQKTAGRYNW